MNENQETIWKQRECKKIYGKLIEYAGGFNVIRKGKRAEAKELAIGYCVSNKEVDYEKFKKGVEKANLISRHKLNKHKSKIKSINKFYENQMKQVDVILNKIWHDFGAEIPLLSKPVLVEDAERLYQKIANDKKIRDMKLFI